MCLQQSEGKFKSEHYTFGKPYIQLVTVCECINEIVAGLTSCRTACIEAEQNSNISVTPTQMFDRASQNSADNGCVN